VRRATRIRFAMAGVLFFVAFFAVLCATEAEGVTRLALLATAVVLVVVAFLLGRRPRIRTERREDAERSERES